MAFFRTIIIALFLAVNTHHGCANEANYVSFSFDTSELIGDFWDAGSVLARLLEGSWAADTPVQARERTVQHYTRRDVLSSLQTQISKRNFD